MKLIIHEKNHSFCTILGVWWGQLNPLASFKFVHKCNINLFFNLLNFLNVHYNYNYSVLATVQHLINLVWIESQHYLYQQFPKKKITCVERGIYSYSNPLSPLYAPRNL